MWATIIIIILVILTILLLSNIVIVPESYCYIIERFGAYEKTLETGLKFKIPVIERVARRINMMEQVLDYPPQPVITKDNVTIQIDTVVYFQINDPKLYSYGVANPMLAMETLTATTLRNIIGELELDQTLTSRDVINARMRSELDEATDPWGIKVKRVEVKNIMPPRDIQEAMEKQMRAEREKRESVLIAEGQKQSLILQSEGEKEAAILRAEAKKIEMLKEAEGHAESIRLHKEAEAKGIMQIQAAEAKAIEMLKGAGMSTDDIVKLKSFEALQVVGNGQSTKIIIPSDIQNITSTIASVKETISDK